MTFNALAQHVGTGPSGQTPIIIQVHRCNTPDERDALEQIFIADGNGEGILAAGVEFSYDQTNDTFGLQSLSSQPVRLSGVRASFQ